MAPSGENQSYPSKMTFHLQSSIEAPLIRKCNFFHKIHSFCSLSVRDGKFSKVRIFSNFILNIKSQHLNRISLWIKCNLVEIIQNQHCGAFPNIRSPHKSIDFLSLSLLHTGVDRKVDIARAVLAECRLQMFVMWKLVMNPKVMGL